MILTDTGPIVALIDDGDEHHKSITAAARLIIDQLATTHACLTEATYLIRRSAVGKGLNCLPKRFQKAI